MPYYSFKKNDIFFNTIKTHPACNWKIHNGRTYYNNLYNSKVNLNTPDGHVNLYEINVNREDDLVYPFLPKGGDLSSFKTVATTNYNKNNFGDIITGSYPMTASIHRERWAVGATRLPIDALRNTLDYYRYLSPHYQYNSTYGDKSQQEISLISIPSIFYGEAIKKGSVELKWYITGTLAGHLRDDKRNGELIQVGTPNSENSGSVAGVVLYNEGFILLTGSWDLGTTNADYDGSSTTPKWRHFGDSRETLPNDAFEIDLQGTNHVPVLNMKAYAPKVELNNSSNPTFLEHHTASAEVYVPQTSSMIYKEHHKRPIKNIVSSSYANYNESFEKITYISKIGIYDEHKNLIAIAKLATPIKKTEDRDFIFKMKLDF